MTRFSEALTLLEHVEAEVDRLLTANGALERRQNELEAEVEHLRRAPDALSQSYAAEREMVERLLEERDKFISLHGVAEAKRAEAELVIETTDKLNEGLRAENERLDGALFEATQSIAKYEEENERLRQVVIELRTRPLVKENERLREENHRLMRSGRGEHDRLKRADELEQENERLRGSASTNIQHIYKVEAARDNLKIEVERLRKERDAWQEEAGRCGSRKQARDEVERLQTLIYRMTAPTASALEEDDRQAAFDEGRAIGLSLAKGEE